MLNYQIAQEIANDYMDRVYGGADVLRGPDGINIIPQVHRELTTHFLKYRPNDVRQTKDFLKQVKRYTTQFINEHRL